ncbi:MAG: MFS transporter [Pseudomonadota bacterium]
MSAQPDLSTPARTETDWWSVATVTIGIAVFAMAQGLTYPLISLLLAQAGTSDSLIGLNAAAYMAGLATSVLVVPSLQRHLRARQVIVAGLLGVSALLVGFAIIDSLAAWFLLRFALGFCVNAIYVFGEAWLNAATADHMRGRVAGLYGTAMSGGFAVGPLAIPLVGTDEGLAFAACAALVSLAAFLLALLSRRAKIEPAQLLLTNVPRFARSAPLLLFVVLIFGFVDAAVLSLAPVFLIADGDSVAADATFLTVMHLGMIVTQPLLGLALDRWDRWRVTAGCMAATALLFTLLSIVPVTSPLIWVVGALAGAAFFGIYTSALALLGREHAGQMLVAGASAFSLAYAAGGILGPPASGALTGLAPGMTFAPVILLSVIGALVLVRQRWQRAGEPPA